MTLIQEMDALLQDRAAYWYSTFLSNHDNWRNQKDNVYPDTLQRLGSMFSNDAVVSIFEFEVKRLGELFSKATTPDTLAISLASISFPEIGSAIGYDKALKDAQTALVQEKAAYEAQL